jgi:hypothetical protein
MDYLVRLTHGAVRRNKKVIKIIAKSPTQIPCRAAKG